MKIITNNAAYVQKNDLIRIMEFTLEMPASVMMKIYGDGEKIQITIVDDRNRYDFVKFDQQHEMEFFEKLDWIVNWDEVKDLSEDEILELAYKINDEKNAVATRWNNMSTEERERNQKLHTEYEALDHKMWSLRDTLWFRQGHIKMTFPEGIEKPKKLKKQNVFQKVFKRFTKKEETK